MADGKVPKALRRRIFKRDGFTCQRCGLVGEERRFPRGGYGHYTPEKGVYLSIDHILPVALGGTNDPSNLRVLCTECNTRKGVKREAA